MAKFSSIFAWELETFKSQWTACVQLSRIADKINQKKRALRKFSFENLNVVYTLTSKICININGNLNNKKRIYRFYSEFNDVNDETPAQWYVFNQWFLRFLKIKNILFFVFSYWILIHKIKVDFRIKAKNEFQLFSDLLSKN